MVLIGCQCCPGLFRAAYGHRKSLLYNPGECEYDKIEQICGRASHGTEQR